MHSSCLFTIHISETVWYCVAPASDPHPLLSNSAVSHVDKYPEVRALKDKNSHQEKMANLPTELQLLNLVYISIRYYGNIGMGQSKKMQVVWNVAKIISENNNRCNDKWAFSCMWHVYWSLSMPLPNFIKIFHTIKKLCHAQEIGLEIHS